MPDQESDSAQSYSSVFGKVILSKFDSMPEWARIFTFFVALAVLVYLTIHSVNTQYFVTGTVLEPSPTRPGSNQAAHGYDVRWSDSFAGTNSKGQYVFVLTPVQYLSLLKDGSHTLEIWQPGDDKNIRDQQICTKPVTFERINGEFDDYYIDGHCQPPQQLRVAPPSFPSPDRPFSLIPAVLASAAPAAYPYRLIVDTIRFSTGWPRSNSAQMTLFQNGAELPVLSLAGSGYGAVSVLPGSSFAFPGGTWLPSASLAGGRIRLSDKGEMFSYNEEWFVLPEPMQLGSRFTLRGARGSELSLVPLGPTNITLFRKYGDDAYFNRLSQDLLSAGVFPLSSASPLGPDAPTNTLFVGPAVPPYTVKAVVAAVAKNGVQLKRIAYPYVFNSTLDPTRIQLGSAMACQNSPAIKPQELATLASLPDTQVQPFLARYKDCH